MSKILMVEDDDDIREMVIEILEQHGFETEGATDGRDALHRLRTGARLPDVIFLDLLMPIMDGAQFRTEQLSDPTLAGVPVVVMSALNDGSARAERLEPIEFLRKPIHSEDLISLATRICERAAADASENL
jgi:CheY-like chemotaxis protein